jgi:hypothetical protein
MREFPNVIIGMGSVELGEQNGALWPITEEANPTAPAVSPDGRYVC